MATYTARKAVVPIGETVDIPDGALDVEIAPVNNGVESGALRVTYLEKRRDTDECGDE